MFYALTVKYAFHYYCSMYLSLMLHILIWICKMFHDLKKEILFSATETLGSIQGMF